VSQNTLCQFDLTGYTGNWVVQRSGGEVIAYGSTLERLRQDVLAHGLDPNLLSPTCRMPQVKGNSLVL
jgi:hypothetical protein